MSKLVDDLVTLQGLMQLRVTASPEQAQQIEALRGEIPPQVLAHFLRQIANGRRGIALVRNGVCGECHLRISQAMSAMLGHTNDILVCETCGAFLAPAPDARTVIAQPTVLPRRRVAKRLEKVA